MQPRFIKKMQLSYKEMNNVKHQSCLDSKKASKSIIKTQEIEQKNHNFQNNKIQRNWKEKSLKSIMKINNLWSQ